MNASPKKFVLITGAAGFLGGHVADACKKAGLGLIGTSSRPPAHAEDWASFCLGDAGTVDYDALVGNRELCAVFHLASSASVQVSVEDPFKDLMRLFPGTGNLLAYLTKKKPKCHFLLFSSAAVYGNPATLPVAESSAIQPISPYGIHKACAETLLMHYARLFELRITVLRIFSAFGPGLKKQIVWDVCRKACEASRDGSGIIHLQGTGAETRDFVYAADIAEAAVHLAEASVAQNFDVLNIASGKEIKISDLAELTVTNLGLPIEIRFSGVVRAGDPLQWRADVQRLEARGFSCKTHFREGMKQTVAWIRQNV